MRGSSCVAGVGGREMLCAFVPLSEGVLASYRVQGGKH